MAFSTELIVAASNVASNIDSEIRVSSTSSGESSCSDDSTSASSVRSYCSPRIEAAMKGKQLSLMKKKRRADTMRSVLSKVRSGRQDEFVSKKHRTRLCNNKLSAQLAVEKSLDKDDSSKITGRANRVAARWAAREAEAAAEAAEEEATAENSDAATMEVEVDNEL